MFPGQHFDVSQDVFVQQKPLHYPWLNYLSMEEGNDLSNCTEILKGFVYNFTQLFKHHYSSSALSDGETNLQRGLPSVDKVKGVT